MSDLRSPLLVGDLSYIGSEEDGCFVSHGLKIKNLSDGIEITLFHPWNWRENVGHESRISEERFADNRKRNYMKDLYRRVVLWFNRVLG